MYEQRRASGESHDVCEFLPPKAWTGIRNAIVAALVDLSPGWVEKRGKHIHPLIHHANVA